MWYSKKGLGFAIIAAVLNIAVSAYAAEKKEIKGQLVSLNSRDSSMTVEVEAKGEKKYVDVKIASDANWHICLAERCAETKGVDGFKKVNEYAGFEAYGIPHKSYKVTLSQSGDVVTSVKVEIAPGKHKD